MAYLLANPIDIETAKKVAINFMNKRCTISNTVKNVIIEELNGQTSFFVINFQKGGWVIVSSDNTTVPVLGYSLKGEYKLEDIKPDAFVELTDNYKKQIERSKKLESPNKKVIQKWNELLSENNPKLIETYTPGSRLLDVPGRGHVQWSQNKNNSGGCFPAYNAFCPTGSGIVDVIVVENQLVVVLLQWGK